ncbi:MAG: lytic transglycosylase domain-containing protein, partial [Rickettsiales bacterium]|nr:lytic transglycosylase domain-containing protein [Rickettsiales bacterium]
QRRGKLASAESINTLVREAWRDGDFEEPQADAILERYGKILTTADHISRTSRLLWEEKTVPAKRMLHLLPDDHEKMFKARIALISGNKLADAQVLLVPSKLKTDPGLQFDRMRYRAKKGNDKGVREILLAAPDAPPFPEKWWRYREAQVREAIGENRHTEALKLLAHHGQVEGQGLADALWLQGWIKCEFQDNPRAAIHDFAEMYEKVRYPVSKARAAYWAGRAAERSGDAQNAASWYAQAARHTTTFYGQLAILKSQGAVELSLPSPPPMSESDKAEFERSDVGKAIRLAMKYDASSTANRLLNLIIENGDNEAEMAQLAELGHATGYPYLSVRAAKKALQQNVVLVKSGYPRPATPKSTGLERPLTLAITRQESEFDPRAKSPSGALGMMQLLPSTAREVAKKHKYAYNVTKLYDPSFNMTLGSLYLKRLIDSYDGSYVLAIGAYNAGPGNVRKWMQAFGTPENNIDKAVNWIETVPFAETRNYIQRVLENLQVFRSLENGTPLKLGEDLKR